MHMTKSSVVTRRTTPVAAASVPLTGRPVIWSAEVDVSSGQRVELIDLTDRIAAWVASVGVSEGMLIVASLHTTCALFTNEWQEALLGDIRAFLESLVPRDGYYRHNDPALSDCDRLNADSHLRATILGHSLALQISGGELVLGHWQRILAAELDGPRLRTLRAQVFGVASPPDAVDHPQPVV